MSDFLDRLATRAIGSDATLEPRLPSLFEPLQRAPIMPPPSGDADAQRPHRVATPPIIATPSPRASSMSAPDAPRAATAPIERTAAPAVSGDAASKPTGVVQPAAIVAAQPSRAVDDRSVTSATITPHPREAAAPMPVQPRQTRVAPSQPDAAAQPRAAVGALLPLPSPGIATSRAAEPSTRSTHAAATRSRAATSERTRTESSEPVVHVSIGRLEVRAAPAAAAPLRRREGPQPGSLDDYLRQRGNKAVP
ncbi:hypothetical protein ACPPVV_16385 [Rhodanobacter sp. Col0626]|uniref:hypothetical protein n=1 Tax=Rhodanobacter sp. Col0626 TaxID=3415679 RepID=UPI003CF3E85A